MNDIFEEYLRISRKEREEIEAATKPIREKYAPLYKELQSRCSHEWKYTGDNITHEVSFYTCIICGAHKSEDK